MSGHSPNKAMAVSSVSLLSILAAQWLNSPASIVQSVVECFDIFIDDQLKLRKGTSYDE